jgi:hypothetical protein
LTARLKASPSDDKSIDVAIGLTEGFVADLGKANIANEQTGYGLVGTYVESPLCWAIVTGVLSITPHLHNSTTMSVTDM